MVVGEGLLESKKSGFSHELKLKTMPQLSSNDNIPGVSFYQDGHYEKQPLLEVCVIMLLFRKCSHIPL